MSPPEARRPIWLYPSGVLAVLAVLAGVLVLTSARAAQVRHEGDRRSQEISAGPRVNVVRAKKGTGGGPIELQGEARAYASVVLYAKVSGYLKDVRVDKGDKVRKGQILAVIESPELDRQYDAAVVDARYKRADAKRAAGLAGPGVVSTRDAELAATQAAVAEAQVATLATQKSYEQLRAPFAGVVTARHADPGALMQNATSSQSSALPVATVSEIDRLRVFVYVDQRNAWAVKVGDSAVVIPPERPGLKITGRVGRMSGSLDPKSRTMLVEVDVDNRSQVLVPGSFVTVQLQVGPVPSVEIPAEALLIRNQKPHAAVVTDDGRAHLRPITVIHLDGSTVSIGAGLAEGELVALNLGNNVADGDRVQPVYEEKSRAVAPNR